MSSSVVRERQYICSCAYQDFEANPDLLGELPYNPPDLVPIVFKLLKTVRSGLIDDEDDEEPPSLELEEYRLLHVEVIRDVGLSRLKLSSPRSRSELKERFIHILSTKLHVPEEEHQTIIDQIFQEVDKDCRRFPLRPLRPLKVAVDNVTVRLRLRPPPPPPPPPPVDFDVFLQMLDSDDGNELLSLITDYEEEGLEKVGPDSLEAKKQESCPICMDDFEEKEDAAPIARLPCLHVFHRHCILCWLHRNPLCPLCRCPLRKKRKLEEILSSSTPIGPSSNIPRLS
ncbi:uncharacterized protein LOC121050341 [Rosa chinensis]|uniref:uncharacterized protein LOC121050341 n=1 Tax=Rosa chinensis TaxID=74649 RepID=UPI001AD8E00A|nr:uncharacterized protein LOC121050341 [Rosa chinensis]